METGRILVAVSADKAEEVFETKTRRPGIERPRIAALAARHVVMLAEHRRIVAVETEHLRDGGGFGQDASTIAREMRGQVRKVADASVVMVPPGQQRGATGGTNTSGVKAVVPLPLRCQLLHVGRWHRAAERARHRKADIIRHEQQDIGCALRRAHRWLRGCFGIEHIFRNGPVERCCRDRQNAAVLRKCMSRRKQGQGGACKLEAGLHHRFP